VDLTPRLNILLDGGVISEENYANVMDIIRYFDECYGIVLTEENSSAFIAHLCIALERASRGEAVNMLDDDVYDDVISQPEYERACQISTDIMNMHPKIPETEARYFNLHLTVMLEGLTG
jgi:transcriptional regulatory protein LevR